MAKLSECPLCHFKQSSQNKICKCGCDLQKAKKNKKVRYWYDYRLDGKQIREFVGETSGEADNGIEQIKYDNNQIRSADRRATFKQLSEWYLNLETVKKLKSYKDIKIVIDLLVETYFKNVKVNELTRTDIENYIAIKEAEGRSPRTIDKHIGILKTMLNRAYDDDKINPRILKAFKNIEKKLIPGSNERDRIISFPEFNGLLENTPDYFKPLFITAFNTGMRLGELRNLKWSMYDKYTEVFRLPPEICKEKRSTAKIVPVNKFVREQLSIIIRCTHHDFIFTQQNREPYKMFRIYKLFKRICDKAEIPYGQQIERGVTPHDIRRSVKTYMLKSGMNESYADIILGHALSGMNKRYIKPTEEMLVNELKKYTDFLTSNLIDSANTPDMLTKPLTKQIPK